MDVEVNIALERPSKTAKQGNNVIIKIPFDLGDLYNAVHASIKTRSKTAISIITKLLPNGTPSFQCYS